MKLVDGSSQSQIYDKNLYCKLELVRQEYYTEILILLNNHIHIKQSL